MAKVFQSDRSKARDLAIFGNNMPLKPSLDIYLLPSVRN